MYIVVHWWGELLFVDSQQIVKKKKKKTLCMFAIKHMFESVFVRDRDVLSGEGGWEWFHLQKGGLQKKVWEPVPFQNIYLKI